LKRVFAKCRPLFLVLRALNTILLRIPKSLVDELLFLIESLRIVKSLDILIVSGGGQLLDWGGPWHFPYTIFKWTFLARASRVPCYYINVGAGPLRDCLSRLFVKGALLLTNYVSFRDQVSRRVAQSLGFSRPAPVFPDNAYSLDIPPLYISRNCQQGEREIVVGFSPMAYRDPRVSFWDKDQAAYDRYISKYSAFASWLARNNYRLRLFSTDIWFDAPAIDDVALALKKDSCIADQGRIARDPIPHADALFSQMASMDYIVTCRFHGVVFAHLMNIPVLALSPHPKVATLMSDLGLSAYCMDITASDPDLLANTFNLLVRDHDRIKASMAETAAAYKMILRRQFNDLLQGALLK
jgi:polysaccharide pyruvyl transferase WcaK-like protein